MKFDKRTKTYYYRRALTGSGIVTAKWKPKVKTSVRELTRPMKSSDGTINYWVHRGDEIFATVFAGQLYIQFRPRFLFSWDGINLMESSDAELKDRKFRKSNFNRNMNQLYDVRFWCRHLFPESEAFSAGIMSLSGFY